MRKKAAGRKNASDGNRLPLDRSTVVQAALELLKRVGLDGLSTRSLAAALGVKSPALYWHFRNKQELFDAMADAMVSGAGMGPPSPVETWQTWLARRARAYRASLLAYRDSARIVTEAQTLSHPRRIVFKENIAFPGQAINNLPALLFFHIDREALLVAIVPDVPGRKILDRRVPMANEIAHARTLYLDHLGTHVRQGAGRKRPGQNLLEGGDLDTGQSASGRSVMIHCHFHLGIERLERLEL